MNFTIGTGYYNSSVKKYWSWDAKDSLSKSYFFKIWFENTKKYSNPKQIVVVDSSVDAEKPDKKLIDSVCWIPLKDNLGHVLDLDSNPNNNIRLAGWSSAFIISAMIAYNNKSDYIFKEQDCLAFNNWTNVFYQKHNYKMLVGNETIKDSKIEQSLFWIRWDYIPDFLSYYLSIKKPDGDAYNDYIRPEHKFYIIMEKNPNDIGVFKMEYGRKNIEAPIPIMECPFYMQQITKNKLDMLKHNNYV